MIYQFTYSKKTTSHEKLVHVSVGPSVHVYKLLIITVFQGEIVWEIVYEKLPVPETHNYQISH